MRRATTATGSVADWMMPMSQHGKNSQWGKHALMRPPVTAEAKTWLGVGVALRVG